MYIYIYTYIDIGYMYILCVSSIYIYRHMYKCHLLTITNPYPDCCAAHKKHAGRRSQSSADGNRKNQSGSDGDGEAFSVADAEEHRLQNSKIRHPLFWSPGLR